MNNLNFIRGNVSPYIPYIGIAVVGAVIGYLGYRAVCWIINKCQRTQKVDKAAQEAFDKTQKITAGYGEYIAFRSDGQQVSEDTFDQVYAVFNKYAPAAMVEQGLSNEQIANRYQTIQQEVKVIDPKLEVAFVPRTLYELMLVRASIQEDLGNKKRCEHKHYGATQTEEDKKSPGIFQAQLNKKNCWHLHCFKDAGDNTHPAVKDMAYRLNALAVQTLSPTPEGINYERISEKVEEEINYLKNHHQQGLNGLANNGVQLAGTNMPGPIGNFACSGPSFGGFQPMGIREDKDANLIRKAVELECSKRAQSEFLLYRGTPDFKTDTCLYTGTSQYRVTQPGDPYSLSYGSGLFAGSLYDSGATAFYFMLGSPNAYVISVPFDQLHTSPFYVPPTNAIAQFMARGESFHGRTKGWKGYKHIGGVNPSGVGQDRSHLQSQLTKEELTAQFDQYKKRAIQLK